MTKPNSDPLGDVSLHWLYERGLELCDCPARDDEMLCHSETCNMSKEYAQLCKDLGYTPQSAISEISWARGSMERHTYICAECGQPGIMEPDRFTGEYNMMVIYQAPLGANMTVDVGGFRDPAYKYPQNIVKVVHSHHNRKGVVSYQRPAPNGF